MCFAFHVQTLVRSLASQRGQVSSRQRRRKRTSEKNEEKKGRERKRKGHHLTPIRRSNFCSFAPPRPPTQGSQSTSRAFPHLSVHAKHLHQDPQHRNRVAVARRSARSGREEGRTRVPELLVASTDDDGASGPGSRRGGPTGADREAGLHRHRGGGHDGLFCS